MLNPDYPENITPNAELELVNLQQQLSGTLPPDSVHQMTSLTAAVELESEEHQQEAKSRGAKNRERSKLSRPKMSQKGFGHRRIDIDESELEGYSNEYRIKHRLFNRSYDKTSRPVRHDDTPTTVYIGMSLYHILDTVSITYLIQ